MNAMYNLKRLGESFSLNTVAYLRSLFCSLCVVEILAFLISPIMTFKLYKKGKYSWRGCFSFFFVRTAGQILENCETSSHIKIKIIYIPLLV